MDNLIGCAYKTTLTKFDFVLEAESLHANCKKKKEKKKCVLSI